MKELKTTLLIVRKNGKILLAEKKRGFGAGKINGVGGKLEPGESFDDAMLRETMEEIAIVPKQWQKMGIAQFDEMVKGERTSVEMALYLAEDFEGTPIETEEVKPVWLDENNLPFDRMFEDDQIWYPYLLAGQKTRASYVYDNDFKLVSHKIEVVDNLD